MTDPLQSLTDQQRHAVIARAVSVALSAGAGCGKTFVLTERFLSHLQPASESQGEPPPQLGQFVAITFTERAAREMRDRIRSACAQRLLDCAEQHVDHWLGLIREIDGARISTIHSFCTSLLRAHAVEARLDPRFRVLDAAQAETLLDELVDEQLHDRLAESDEAVIELAVQFGLDRLGDMIGRLLRRRQDIDWAQWQAETAEGLAARWAEYWRREGLPRLVARICQSAAARTLLALAQGQPSSNPTMCQRCAVLAEKIAGLAESRDPAADLAAILENAKVQGGGSKKVWQSESAYEEFRDAAAKLREIVKRVQPQMAFDAQAALRSAEAGLRLLGVTAGVAGAYEARKRELAVLDFDDLLIRAKDLLVGPARAAVRSRLAAHLRLLLVDEFQDTDPLQVELIEALCASDLGSGKLFVVGDYKQSIYRFRGADPHVFQRLREMLPAAGRLPLSLNFRSQPAVLDFVNALFREELGPQYEPLEPSRPQIGPRPAVEFLWATDHEPAGPGGPDDSTPPAHALPQPVSEDNADASPQADCDTGGVDALRRLEADWIARRIRGMLDSGEKLVWDKDAARAGTPAVRAVQPGDIALLFRALSNVDLYEEALRRYGISYYLVGGHAFYAQQEIFDVVNLLRALESPADDVSLAGALRSPMFGLLDETLFWLAQHPDGLGAGLMSDERNDELGPEQRQRVDFAARVVAELRAMKNHVPIARLLQELLDRTAYDAVLLAEFLGPRKLANLHKLIDQARSFDQAGIFTLSDFITQLSEFIARQPDEPLAATHPESVDAVRLMTIHQAKGLEFPVVIVPDVDRTMRGPSAPVAFTRQLGPLVKVPGCPGGFDLYTAAESDEELQELTRLLYVATTRAGDYLILSAGLRGLESCKGPWMELLRRRFDCLTGIPRDGAQPPVPPQSSGDEGGATAGEASLVRVTTARPPLGSKAAVRPARQDLEKLIQKARRLAARGSGRIPEHLGPVLPDPKARRHFSFSRLSGQLHASEVPAAIELPELDESAGPPGLDPRGLGTLIHAVLAEVDFAAPGDVARLVHRHALRHLPEGTAELDEPIAMVCQFLDSPRAAELAAARQVHRELEFLLAWPIDGPRSGQFLEGFIDCLYQTPAGAWRLLDYKSNRVTAATMAQVAAEYEMQMLLYALATQRILGQWPEELVLCFLRPGLEYHFPCGPDSARRAIELITSAIQPRPGTTTA